MIKNLFIFKPNKKNKFQLEEKKPQRAKIAPIPEAVYTSSTDNLQAIKEIYTTELNSDIKIRELKIGEKHAFIVFVENLINSDFVNEAILAPIILSGKTPQKLTDITERLIVNNQVRTESKFRPILQSINLGDCVLFVDGISQAILCDVKNWNRRSVSEPVTESVIYGPHEGFNENFKINTSLIRKTVRNENLICETLFVGNVSQTPCALMYMKNIVNPELLDEIKRRLSGIDADYVMQAGELEQYIEDSTFSLVPQMLTTERPDKASDSLIEGKIVLILQGSPLALVLPVTGAEFITATEDRYIRFPFAILMKLIRILGILASFLLSGLYIAVVNFHPEIIPTNLLFAIEATREAVPFSAFTELLIMEAAFDIIREASIRVPSPIGSTLGIIGGLIIGQAAVSANLVSPIAIIIVAITGIGSFATPNYALNFTFRFLRYIYIVMGAVAGFFGISLVMFLNACSLCVTNSLGVPLFNSFANDRHENILRALFPYPIWKRQYRHRFIHPQKIEVQGKISRKWDE